MTDSETGHKTVGELLRQINPEMDPKEVVRIVSLIHQPPYSETPAVIIRAREKLIEDAGHGPKEGWVYYSNYPGFYRTEDEGVDMEKITQGFPLGVEFLVVNRAYIGGVENSDFGFGIAAPVEFPDHLTVFIRVRPSQLEDKS